MADKSLYNALKAVLADCYALCIKTQNYHWNVEGPRFKELHQTFQEHYDDLFEAIDTVAELIRGIGEKSPGTFDVFSKLASIKNGNEDASAEQMLKDIYKDQTIIQKTLTHALKIAEHEKDEVVIGFLIERLTHHRKAAWMLKSSL